MKLVHLAARQPFRIVVKTVRFLELYHIVVEYFMSSELKRFLVVVIS